MVHDRPGKEIVRPSFLDAKAWMAVFVVCLAVAASIFTKTWLIELLHML
jgi:hypothetical protein